MHLTALCNGKQEAFWGTLEGRLMKMLDGVADLTLELLNEATQAWVEIEYNRAVHRETSCSPVDRFAKAPDVFRSSPSSEALRDAFRLETKRELSVRAMARSRWTACGSRFRHGTGISAKFPSDTPAGTSAGLIWSTSRSGTVLAPIYPLDKTANADGRRASIEGNSLDMELDHGPREPASCRPS